MHKEVLSRKKTHTAGSGCKAWADKQSFSVLCQWNQLFWRAFTCSWQTRRFQFTSRSSFSICTARWTMGPRTAYSTRFTFGFMFSTVSTFPRHDTPFTACWDILARLRSPPFFSFFFWGFSKEETKVINNKQKFVTAEVQIVYICGYQLLCGESKVHVCSARALGESLEPLGAHIPSRAATPPSAGWLDFLPFTYYPNRTCQWYVRQSFGKK